MDSKYTILFAQIQDAAKQSPELMETIHQCAELRDEAESIAEVARFAAEVSENSSENYNYYSGT